MQRKTFFVYILSSRSRNLYIGITSDLVGRVWEHKTKALGGHTSRYSIDRLVYLEEYGRAADAIDREKEMKDWRRERKVALIEAGNGTWDDLAANWYDSLEPNTRQSERQKQIPTDRKSVV